MEKISDGKRNILFLHGFGIRFNSYMPLLKELSKEYTVYFTNLSGHGTEKAVNDLDELIDVLEQKVRKLNLDNLIIVGHSFGGLCAAKLALRLEDIVTDVLLFNPALVKSRYSKFQIMWKYLIEKNIKGLLLYPNLFSFYVRLLSDFIYNLIIQNINTGKTRRIVLKAMLSDRVNKFEYRKNINFKIITSRRDSIVNYNDLVSEYYKDVVLVDGEHDWLMADVKKSAEIIEKLISG